MVPVALRQRFLNIAALVSLGKQLSVSHLNLQIYVPCLLTS